MLLCNNSDTDFHISIGDRVAQLIFHPLAIVNPILTDNLEESSRGEKGFGSSGV
jgi:dUTP pyrophosphatase